MSSMTGTKKTRKTKRKKSELNDVIMFVRVSKAMHARIAKEAEAGDRTMGSVIRHRLEISYA